MELNGAQRWWMDEARWPDESRQFASTIGEATGDRAFLQLRKQ
jgi:hypothetical protein